MVVRKMFHMVTETAIGDDAVTEMVTENSLTHAGLRVKVTE